MRNRFVWGIVCFFGLSTLSTSQAATLTVGDECLSEILGQWIDIKREGPFLIPISAEQHLKDIRWAITRLGQIVHQAADKEIPLSPFDSDTLKNLLGAHSQLSLYLTYQTAQKNGDEATRQEIFAAMYRKYQHLTSEDGLRYELNRLDTAIQLLEQIIRDNIHRLRSSEVASRWKLQFAAPDVPVSDGFLVEQIRFHAGLPQKLRVLIDELIECAVDLEIRIWQARLHSERIEEHRSAWTDEIARRIETVDAELVRERQSIEFLSQKLEQARRAMVHPWTEATSTRAHWIQIISSVEQGSESSEAVTALERECAAVTHRMRQAIRLEEELRNAKAQMEQWPGSLCRRRR